MSFKHLKKITEKLDQSFKLSPSKLDQESGEFERSGIPIEKAQSGRGASLPNLKGVGNTDTEDFDPNKGSRFSLLKKWAKTLQGHGRDTGRRRNVYNQVTSNTDDPSIIATGGRNKRELIGGNSRASLRRLLSLPIKTHIFKR